MILSRGLFIIGAYPQFIYTVFLCSSCLLKRACLYLILKIKKPFNHHITYTSYLKRDSQLGHFNSSNLVLISLPQSGQHTFSKEYDSASDLSIIK